MRRSRRTQAESGASSLTELGRARRTGVRVLAALALLAFSFMLVFAAIDAVGRIGEVAELEPPGSREAQIGADHPGEAVHITGALAAAAIGATGLVGLFMRPQRAGSATHTGAAALAMLAAIVVVGNPDNHGGQAGLVDPAFLMFVVPSVGAALLAAPWRAWRPRAVERPRLLMLAAVALPGLWYGLDQGLMQRNTWPPMADPHHQVHWYAMSVVALAIVLVVASSALRGRGWRAAATVAGGATAGVAIVSLLDPDAASALHPLWAIGAVAWGLAVIAITWTGARDRTSSGYELPAAT
jgi:hypothetical protein